MFTGIITNLATLKNLEFNAKKDVLLTLEIKKSDLDRKLKIGCSIACNGICLTLISQKIAKNNLLLFFQASQETCNKTTLQNWQINQKINIEFSMRLNDEFGGHLVSGHIDNISKIIAIKKIKDSWKFDFEIPKKLEKFIAPKGSVTINGTSLTINEVSEKKFSINVIKHTMENTIFQHSKVGDLVNLEIDLIARYLSQLIKNHD
jgi:riboflavin synthase